MNFWAHASNLALLLASAPAWAQSPERFEADLPPSSEFRINHEGIRVKGVAADRFTFVEPLRELNLVESTSFSAVYWAPTVAGSPDRVRLNSFSPGADLHASKGLKLHLSSLRAPILTVDDASYTGQLSSPPKPWVLVSFANRQPPVMIGFLGEPQPIQVTGSAGDWTLSTPEEHEGWMRFCLPFGQVRSASSHVSNLGAIAKRLTEEQDLWLAEPPILKDFRAAREGSGIRALWEFDRPGALIPAPVLLSNRGGWPVTSHSPIKTVDAPMLDGQTAFLESNQLVMRFGLKALLPGRPISLGDKAPPPELPSEYSRDAALAACFQVLRPDIKLSYRAQVEERVQAWSEAVPADSMDQAICSLLDQSLIRSKDGREASPTLTQTLRQFDWRTWTLGDGDDADRRTSIAAIASAQTKLPIDQALGCLMRAGLAAKAALPAWRESQGLPGADGPTAALPGVLAALYGGGKPHPHALTWLSPGSVVGGDKLIVIGRGREARLAWQANSPQFRVIGPPMDPRYSSPDLVIGPKGDLSWPNQHGLNEGLFRLPEGKVWPFWSPPPSYSEERLDGSSEFAWSSL